jgi:hypothetical protein
MAKGADILRMRWLLRRLERRRSAIQHQTRDGFNYLLITAMHEALKVLPIDACSGFGAFMAKNASRRYAELDVRARENLKQIQPEQSDPASIDATMSRLWRSVARTRAELSVLNRLWRAGRIAVEGVEYMDAARAASRPILGVVLHLGNWEAMGVACLAIGYPVAAVYVPDENPFAERFRAGCGRILAGWEGLLPEHTALVGCDINPKLIEFCTANIRFARTFVSDFLPPINGIANAQFDFVYVASVFTHLTLPAARAWASELARIIKSNGTLMMSYHGARYETDLSKTGLRELRKNGFYCYLDGTSEQTHLGSNKYATYMKEEFVRTLFEGFEPITIIFGETKGPNAFASYQDIAIFRRSSPFSSFAR